ncbi:MAG: radical SAM protein [Thermodesulfobacteriota bacterium]|nr:radical SAM protein [Thermodesulfobacteriota bacterium]
MKNLDFEDLPYMLYADKEGRIYDHPYYRMAGFSGNDPVDIKDEDLIPVPEFSKLFYIPGCPPIGLDPLTGECITVSKIEIDGIDSQCFAVAVFLEPGLVRTHLPAVDYSRKDYYLPMWAYTTVGFRDDEYWAAGFRMEYNHRWDPRNYDDMALEPAIKEFKKENLTGPLTEHLINCATNNHCFAAKNLFLKRWEAPMPVSRGCNAMCLGCLSLQPDHSCGVSHQRISFRPRKEEIITLAVSHLNNASDAIISFGQGCEGEPLTESRLIADSIREIREQTGRGTINLNTNGSLPDRVRLISSSGLDSIRISINSARPELYRAYYRPKGYDFNDVVSSIALSREMGLYTMINYLVFPGITDCEEEIEAIIGLIRKTGANFIHFKNLNIDPYLYMEHMPESSSPTVGIKRMLALLEDEFPHLQLGYFNKAVR